MNETARTRPILIVDDDPDAVALTKHALAKAGIKTQIDVMQEARVLLKDYPDLRAAVQDVAAFSSSGFRQVDIDLNIVGPDMEKLKQYSEEVADHMRKQGHYGSGYGYGEYGYMTYGYGDGDSPENGRSGNRKQLLTKQVADGT